MGKRTAPTSAGWLPLLAPHLPACLVDPATLDRLTSLMQHLPATVSGALEIRLGESGGPVDLAVRVSHPEEARRIARWLRRGSTGRFLEGWARQRDPQIPFVWLEFDLPVGGGPSTPLLIPRVGLGVSEEWVAGTLLPALRGAPPAPRQLATIRRALCSMPEGARCSYVFDLRPRGTEAIRLSFSRLAPAVTPQLLAHLDRPDLARSIEEMVVLAAEADRREVSFDIDADGAINPRVGLEISFASWAGQDPRWPRLFDRLVAAGLCQGTRRDAALGWPGYDSRRTAPGHWPRSADFAAAYLVRWISHVKLVCAPGRPVEAKVYLFFALWTRGSSGRLVEGAVGLETAGRTAAG